MKVVYTLPDETGCTFYRAMQPLNTARKNGRLGVLSIAKFDNPLESTSKMEEADVIMIQRVTDPMMLEVIEAYKKKGKKIVLDWDDDIFNVSPLTPAYGEVGTAEYRPIINGERMDVWKDGVGFNLKKNLERIEAIKRICEMVDMITVTTDRLGDVYREFNDNVKVLPNCVDLNLWKKLPFKDHGPEIRIGWFGGYSHFEDWAVISDAIAEIMNAYPYAKLVILGQVFPSTLKRVKSTQIEAHGWSHIHAYPYKSATLDIDLAIIPLQDKKFNWGKSPIKWIEMAALQIPAVTSYISPYAEVMDVVPNNGIFVEHNQTDSWVKGISEMIDNLPLRQQIAQAAHQTVVENFDINTQFHQWVNAYEELQTWQRRQTPLLQK